ncbi:glycine N-methyltransferase-like, partial [Enhydra lutris kenyoni]|uniref:Glycine N-methyltransferase n=1 Tax=Enhydra lutris kenyoni TaxID=391180 RepID=A0A2Y9JG74_ENHLU
WMTLDNDVPLPPGGGFDAVICLGNSFAHLPDCKGDQSEHRLALKNITSMVRSGGLLVIDHRNYDHILSTGCAPPGKNIYYKSDLTKDITTSVLTVNNKAHIVALDYMVQVPGAGQDGSPGLSKFRLTVVLQATPDMASRLMRREMVVGEHQGWLGGLHISGASLPGWTERSGKRLTSMHD